MPDILCKEPGCTHLITDPCVKLVGLFRLHKDLSERLNNTKEEGQQALLNSVDQLLEKELGINTSNNKVFLGMEEMRHASDPILFTLKCIQGHIHQYSITCQS
jgi:hypothetical protein